MTALKNRTEVSAFIPSFLDDYPLDPYEFRLYARIQRRAGTSSCWESIPNMATACQMSLSKARKALRFLVAAGLVSRSERVGATSEWTINSHQSWIETQCLEALRKQLNQARSDRSCPPSWKTPNPQLNTPIKSDTPITFDTPTKSDTPIKCERTTPTKSDRPPLSNLIDEGTPLRESPEGSSPLTPQGEREKAKLEFQNSKSTDGLASDLDATDLLVNSHNPVEDKSSAVPGEIVKKYDRALGIRPPVDWASCQQRHFDWVSGGPWLINGKLDPNFVTWQALDWQKSYGGDLHKKRADVLRHFKKDPANLAIAWEQYSSEQIERYENAAVRMHNGLEIKLDEQQQLIQHSRAVTERLPEEISPVAFSIQPDSVLSAAPGYSSEALHSASEPIKVFEKASVFHTVKDDGESWQHEPETVFNHFGTIETTQGEHWRGDLANPCSTHPCMKNPQLLAPSSVPTDSSGMSENSDAYHLWKPQPIEGEPVTPEQFRVLLAEFSQRLAMPVQQHPPKVSDNSEIEELNHWLADPLLRKEVMPRVMKGDRYSVEFDEHGEPLRVVE